MAAKSSEIIYNKDGQGEFFANFQWRGGKKTGYFKEEIAFGRKTAVSVSYENLALFFIYGIMALVIFFALGVEKGRRLADKGIRPYVKSEKRVEAAAKVKAAYQETWYTIQVIAVRRVEDARREAARLNNIGHKALILKTGEWFNVCAGRYAGAADAGNDLPAIRAEYPGCYVRKIGD